MAKSNFKLIKDGVYGGVVPRHIYLNKVSDLPDNSEYMSVHGGRDSSGVGSTIDPTTVYNRVGGRNIGDIGHNRIYIRNTLPNAGCGKLYTATNRFRDGTGAWIGGAPTDRLGLHVYPHVTVEYPDAFGNVEGGGGFPHGEPVNALLTAMGRNLPSERERGRAFVVMRCTNINMNTPVLTIDGIDYSYASATVVRGASASTSLWLRVVSGGVVMLYHHTDINGVPDPRRPLTSADGWVHVSCNITTGSNYGYPGYIAATEGGVFEVALPHVAGSNTPIRAEHHTAPLT